MKLLHVIAGTGPESGGPIEALLRISEILVREGHQVEVVCLEEEHEVAERRFPFPITGLGHGTHPYRFNPRLTPWLRENAGRFDSVILHGLWNYSSFGSWRALAKSSTPYYIFAHGMMDPWFREHYPLKHIAKMAYWWLIEGRTLRDAANVLFTCEEERVRARNVFKGHIYKERVLRFGTADPDGAGDRNTAAFYAAFPELQQKRFLLFLSRIHPKKGCDLLLQAFVDVAASAWPDLDLVMAGPDQVGWAHELKLLAMKLGIGERVHWAGMLGGDIKWGAFRAADAMILPSHQENFGFAVVEAMACSTPVLISDKVNIWREVQSSQSGFVEPDTLEGTRSLIRRFFALSREQHSLMRKAARQGFLRHFDVESTAADILELIQSVKANR
jgi:glycosyltransferase involved in cell wall biosynthesis